MSTRPNKEYLLEIYKIESEKYSKTREVHWKFNIAFWTVLIVAIYAQYTEKFNLAGLGISSIGFNIYACHNFYYAQVRSMKRCFQVKAEILKDGKSYRNLNFCVEVNRPWPGFKNKLDQMLMDSLYMESADLAIRYQVLY